MTGATVWGPAVSWSRRHRRWGHLIYSVAAAQRWGGSDFLVDWCLSRTSGIASAVLQFGEEVRPAQELRLGTSCPARQVRPARCHRDLPGDLPGGRQVLAPPAEAAADQSRMFCAKSHTEKKYIAAARNRRFARSPAKNQVTLGN